MNKILLLLISFVFTVSNTVYAAPLSDSEAAMIMTKFFNSSFFLLPIGEFNVIGGVRKSVGVKDNWQNREITEDTLKGYKIWESEGIVTVKKLEYDKGSFKEMEDLTMGVIMKVKITPTAKGLSLQKPMESKEAPRNSSLLYFPPGQISIKKIVRNEERKLGVNEYRIVMYTCHKDYWPVNKSILVKKGESISEEKKGIALFKYDAFKASWNIVSTDAADLNEEFKTSHVDDYLKKSSSSK